jgi:ATP adenylyltransferase
MIRMLSPSLVHETARRALASGALQPIESRTLLLDSEGVRFVLRTVSSLARKAAAIPAAASADPLGEPDPALFVADIAPAHHVLLNKFPLLTGHLLLVTRRFEPQESLLTIEDFAALAACLGGIDGLAFYNGGAQAGASQPRKHLQLVPLPLAPESPDDVPIERVLDAGTALPFRHAYARVATAATPSALHALYRDLLRRCGICAVATAGGEVQSAPYNLLVRRGWMLVVPRSSASFESILVNGLGFAGTLVVRSEDALERVRAVGPMQVLRAVAMTATSA